MSALFHLFSFVRKAVVLLVFKGCNGVLRRYDIAPACVLVVLLSIVVTLIPSSCMSLCYWARLLAEVVVVPQVEITCANVPRLFLHLLICHVLSAASRRAGVPGSATAPCTMAESLERDTTYRIRIAC